MPFTTIDGIRTHYVVQGSGPHLLMFASGGFRSVISRWTAQGGKGLWQDMDALNALSKHYTVIAYDRREAGLSGGRVECLSWDLYARQAKGLLDHLGVARAYMLGGCMGASLALRMGVLYPDACKGLIMHWPVGGYRWLARCRSDFQRHIDFVREHGLAGVVARAPKGENFFLDPEIGPWGSPAAVYPEFAAELLAQNADRYLELVACSRDTLFPDTLPSGTSGEEMLNVRVPAIVMSGADNSHPMSAAWTLKELLPGAELWDVFPPHQNAQNLYDRLVGYITAQEASST